MRTVGHLVHGMIAQTEETSQAPAEPNQEETSQVTEEPNQEETSQVTEEQKKRTRTTKATKKGE